MKNHSKASILSRYNELQPANGSKWTPRPGFYQIKRVYEHGTYSSYEMATALWKEREEDNFHPNAEVEIGLLTLRVSCENPSTFDPNSLVNNIVHVKSQTTKEISVGGTNRPCILNEWSLIPEKRKPSFLEHLRSDPSILEQIKNDPEPPYEENCDNPEYFDDEAYEDLD